MKLLIKYPCRSRFSMLKKNLKQLNNNIVNSETKILLSIDKDDNSIYDNDKLIEIKPYINNVKVMLSNSFNKINALNRDLDSLDWDYVLFVTDYIEIIKKGFDDSILKQLENSKNYPAEKTALKLGSKNNNGIEKNYIYVVPYSFYCENKYVFNPVLMGNFHYELLEYEIKKEYQLITDSITENAIHKYVHPKWGYYEKDELNMKSLSYWKNDLKVFKDAVSVI